MQPERLRFDFSHGGPINGPTLGKIEAICNQQLAADLDIFAKDVALSDARQINGAHPSSTDHMLSANTVCMHAQPVCPACFVRACNGHNHQARSYQSLLVCPLR